MRAEAIRTLVDLAADDPRIVLLTGDLGYGVIEPFFESFPERAFNVGVAEQNMVAMSTGLAEDGLIPYIYSIATFATLRPFEFIRNGPIMHQLPVRVIGVGGGMEYTNNGPTHLALEDIGVLRTQPGISIFAPNDVPQARAIMEATWDLPGPIYYRLSKQSIPAIEGLPRWSGGGVDVLRRGSDGVAILALGACASSLEAARAAAAAEGVSVTTVAVSAVAPVPRELLADLLGDHRLVAVVESHYVNGGLGSVVCELVAEGGHATRVVRCAVERLPVGVIGGMDHLARWAGIDAESVGRRVAAAATGSESTT